jgi:hypothetical protein
LDCHKFAQFAQFYELISGRLCVMAQLPQLVVKLPQEVIVQCFTSTFKIRKRIDDHAHAATENVG